LGSRLEPGNRFLAEYGAPEHFRKTYGAVGPTTDVYGLALVFIEVVSGRRALEGEDHTELSQRTTNSVSRPTLRSRGVVTPDSIEAALLKALAVNPKDRFPTARIDRKSVV